jgi:DNA polymerase III subunit delta
MAAKKKHNLFLVHGEDEYQVSEKAREIVGDLCPPEEVTEKLEVMEGGATKIDEVEQLVHRVFASMQTLGMFSSEKVIWLRDVDWLPDSKVSKYEGVKSATLRLEKQIKAGIPSDTTLVISAQRKVSGRSAFFKSCKAAGEVILFEKPEQSYKSVEYATGMLRQMLRDHKIQADEHVIAAFISRAGTDTRQLANEANKMVSYLGDRNELTTKDVALMVAPSRELVPWELADFIAERDFGGAMDILQRLLEQRQSEVAIISGLITRFRELSLYRALLDSGKAQLARGSLKYADAEGPEAALAVTRRRKHPYAEFLTAQAANRFTRGELAKARTLIADTHDQLFWSALPKQLLLEMLVIKLLGNSGR